MNELDEFKVRITIPVSETRLVQVYAQSSVRLTPELCNMLIDYLEVWRKWHGKTQRDDSAINKQEDESCTQNGSEAAEKSTST